MKEFLKMLPNDSMDMIIGVWIVLVVLALVGYYVYLRFVKRMKPKASLFRFLANLEGCPKEGGNDAGKN